MFSAIADDNRCLTKIDKLLSLAHVHQHVRARAARTEHVTQFLASNSSSKLL